MAIVLAVTDWNFQQFFPQWNCLQAAFLAQSGKNVAEEGKNQAQEIVAKITTPRVLQAFLTVAAAYALIYALDWVIIRISERAAKEKRLRIKQSLPFLRMLILSTTAAVLMNLLLNLSRENVLAVTGTVAVALGFAFKDYASSIIAGVLGLFEAPYRIGDRIRIDEDYGEVVSYGLRGVRLQTPTDNLVSIPHNKIWTTAISNANAGDLEAQVVTSFYLAHEADPQVVHRILLRVAQTSKYTQLNLPIAMVMEEHNWGSLYRLKSYPTDARDEFLYQTDLTMRAKQAFRTADIAYPRLPGFEQN